MGSTWIGFIGLGEAGSAFAEALRAGGASVCAFDPRHQAGSEGALEKATGIVSCSIPTLFERCEIVLSTVTTDRAREAARSGLPFMGPRHVYCDFNSTAPSVKTEIADLLAPSGAVFIEGAILGAIGVTGAKTRILLGGPQAQAVSERLNAAGLNTVAYSPTIGKASTFKMLRSIFTKGTEALLLELLLAARKADLEAELWQDLVDFMERNRFSEVAANWVCSHAVAHERRHHEMIQVCQVMRELGCEAIVTEATCRFFERSTALRLSESFVGKPDETKQVVDALLDRCAKR